ncbi:hypothetical protein N2152v2_008470 [Parachlorella kessleri]
MQLHSNNSGLDILDNLNNSQRNWRSTPTGTIRVNFTVDPLLQTRYLGPGWQLQPWLPEAPSVFPDQELVVSTATGGFLSGKQVKTTGYIDYFWCSDSTCEAVLDLAYLHNNWTGTCDFGVALAALPHSVAVPTAPTAVAGSSAPAAAARSQGSKRSSSLSKHKSGSLGVELPQQHAVPAGVSTPQQVARTVSAPQQASGGDRAPRALSQRHRVLTM